MRTNIDIDDKLMKAAMKATGAPTKKAAVEAALRKVVQLNAQSALLKLRGKIVWRGHEDDWFASDEEILKRRRAVTEASKREPKASPLAPENIDSKTAESRR
jgi:Arc/MetJ family transcription regulator